MLEYYVRDKSDELWERQWYEIRGGHKVLARISKQPVPLNQPKSISNDNKSNINIDIFKNKSTPSTPSTLSSTSAWYNREPVVLVPGLVVSGLYMIPLAEALAPWLPVSIIDLPGYGESVAKDNRILTFDELVDSLVAYLDAANIKRASFIGNSFGCQLIASLAARYPSRVDRCILQGPTIQEGKRSVTQQLLPWLVNGAKEGTPSMNPIMMRDYWVAGWRRIRQTIQMCLDDRIENSVPNIKCPTLYVSGDRDLVSPVQWCQKLDNLTAVSKLVVLKKCTHTANYATPMKFARVARPFLMNPSVFSDGNINLDDSNINEIFRDIPESSADETVDVELPNIADFDSASGMLRAVGSSINGMEFKHLGVSPPLLPIVMPLFNYLPEKIRDTIYAYVGAMEAIKPNKMCTTSSEDVAEQIVKHFPKGIKYPAIAIGSSNGALTHAYAAMGIPWLPQTFLVPVKRPYHEAFEDGIMNMEREMEWGKKVSKQYLKENPGLELYHMADPNQDSLMVQHMAYFRFKFIALPNAYRKFIEETLAPGGTILCTDCNLRWKLKNGSERYNFQAGAFGGLTPDDYIYGNEQVKEKLKNESKSGRDDLTWNAPKEGLIEGPEAEWGFVESLRMDLQKLANENEFHVKKISFKCPDTPSPLVANLFRQWYKEIGIKTDDMLVSSFIFMEPFQTIRMGLVPYWTAFSVENCVDGLEKYLKEQKEQGTPFARAFAMLFSHGTYSIGIAKLDRWRNILQSSNMLTSPGITDEVFVGVDTRCYPKDFACVINYNPDLKAHFPSNHTSSESELADYNNLSQKAGNCGRYTIPPPMEWQFFDKFVLENGGKYDVQYI